MWQSTLADSFLADFDDEEAEEDDIGRAARQPSAAAPSTSSSAASSTPPPPTDGATPVDTNGHTTPARGSGEEEEEEEEADGPHLPLSHQPSSLSPLLISGSLPGHVSSLSILLHSAVPPSSEVEMVALSSSIRYVSSIDAELVLVHRFVRELYGVRFGELEQLLSSAVEYARVVLALGNFTADTVGLREVERELQTFLPHHLVLSITVTATTSGGRRLSEEEWRQVGEGCHTILTLHEHRQSIVSYMEGRMSVLAPNLSALVGSTVAAHLISVAGGLRRLSEIPACNLQVLGTRKQRQAALSSVSQDLHVGVIGQSAILQSCPTALRRRAVRLLAGKMALACRIDEQREDRAGARGRQLRAEVEVKIDKWQEPPPSSITKALPAPLAQSNKKRRGGKRYRKERERSQLSELHKAKNRMAFGKEELVDEYTGEEFGMIGQEGGGSIKLREAGAGQKLSNRLSKEMQKRLGYGQGKGGGGTVTVGGGGGGGGTQSVGGAVTVIGGGGGGTASSIAFTPVQGMELVNNEHKRLKAGDGDKYFASTATFVKLGPKAPDKKALPAVPKF